MNIGFDFNQMSHILTNYHISSQIFYLGVRFSEVVCAAEP